MNFGSKLLTPALVLTYFSLTWVLIQLYPAPLAGIEGNSSYRSDVTAETSAKAVWISKRHITPPKKNCPLVWDLDQRIDFLSPQLPFFALKASYGAYWSPFSDLIHPPRPPPPCSR